MNKRILLGCALLLAAGSGGAQSATTTDSLQRASVAPPKSALDVLFATNEDADLYLNGQPQGLLSKTGFRYIKLSPGIHAYTVRSRTTQDEFRDSVTVAAGKLNEVFVDLLYLVDQQNAARQQAAKAAENAAPTAGGLLRPTVFQTKKVEEVALLNFFLANLVPVKGGGFVMGNNRSPLADEKEHAVTLSPFFVSKYEVTQFQWQTLMGTNPSYNKDCPTCPVENVSWNDALRYIQKLNSLSDKKFRLPTEAEWEYVARMGGKAEIDEAGGPEAYIRKTAWHFQDAEKKTHPVGRKLPNVTGAFDLLGNVSEWCADWYDVNIHRSTANAKDPLGPANGKQKVVRGGNYRDYAADRFRPSLRRKRIPSDKSSDIGFRLVMDWNPTK